MWRADVIGGVEFAGVHGPLLRDLFGSSSGSDSLRTTTRPRWAKAPEGLCSALLVDHASYVSPSASVAGAIEHGAGDRVRGAAQGGPVV